MNLEKQSTSLQMTLREVNRVGEGQKNVPKLRFKGYKDAWEQRKVAEITKFHKQGYYTTEEYNDNKKYYLLRGTDLTGNKLVLKDTPKIDATEKDYDAFKTEIGDFLIVRSGNVGTYGIVDVDIPAIFGSYLIDFRFDTEKVTNEFFGYFYQSERFQSQLNKITQSSANININAENIKSTYISLPVLNEQKKISNIMSALDNCITLHQRKYNALKSMKKTLLSKMFPKNREDVPEIRFKGFTDAWEQRKLGALVQFVNGRAYKQEELLDVGKYKVVRVGNFNTNEKWYFSDLELETDKYIDNGDLLYLWATSFGPVIWQGEKAIFHYHIWKLKNFESLDKKYLYSFLEWDKNKISQNTNGSTMVHITKNMIEQRDIEYPTNSEQYRIGSLLESIDNLITLHQRKLDELKNMKKTLLQQMFV